jgi:hypothetical protein
MRWPVTMPEASPIRDGEARLFVELGVFERFSAIDWAKYDTAPALDDLRIVASPKSTAREVDAAVWRIQIAVYDQACPHEATVDTVPFLIEILAAKRKPSVGARAAIAGLLGRMYTSCRDDMFDPLLDLDELGDAIERGRVHYVRLLDDRDADVRAAAAHLVGYLPRCGAAIARRLGRERDPRVVATLLLAAAAQKRKLPAADYLDAKDPRVRACAAIAAVALDPDSIGQAEIVDALIAALDDATLDEIEPIRPFYGHLRIVAADTMGRFGRGHDAIVDALLARRGSTDPVNQVLPVPTTIGKVAVGALAAIAVPHPGAIDGEAGRRIIAAMLDADPGFALGMRGIDGEPAALRQLVGLEPSMPTPLDDEIAIDGVRVRVADACLALATATTPYDPTAVLDALASAVRGEARVDLVRDLASGRGGLVDQWSYGKLRGDFAAGNQSTIAERRHARICDLCVRLLLRDDGVTIGDRIDRELAALAAAAESAKTSLAPYDHQRRYGSPMMVLGLARALLRVRAGEAIPPALHDGVVGAAYAVYLVPYVRELIPHLDDATILRIGIKLWWFADVSPAALRALTTWARECANKNWVAPPQTAFERVARSVDAAALEPVMREVAKAKATWGRKTTWTSPDGDVIEFYAGPQVSELDDEFGNTR